MINHETLDKEKKNYKRIAIITPCIMPVPAVAGGAVEALITRIISDNELNGNYQIDLYTILDEGIADYHFKYTNIVKIKTDNFIHIVDSISDKAYRRIPNCNSRRLIDHTICKVFLDRIEAKLVEYDAVIIENIASTAIEILKNVSGKYAFPLYFHIHNDIDIYRSPDDIKKLAIFGIQFIAVSKYMKSRIHRYVPNAVVHVLNNGIDLQQYERCIKETADTFSFLYAGRVIKDKGIMELCNAFEKLLNNPDVKQKNYSLDIVGFSDRHTKYEKSILKIASKYPDNIKCINRLSTEDMAKKYREYDVVVMPSVVEETFGLVALETMAKGMALITTNSGALPEVVADGALVVNKSKKLVDNLADAMFRISTDEDFRKELQERAYKRAHSIREYDIKAYYNNFVDIIDGQFEEDDIISVIVPVYNVSSYLTRCVNSITGQTYSKLEIILVDDGSTDDSGALCDEFSAMDERIIVIHQENMGLSGARNTGMDAAGGKYLFFCDSDDYLQTDALERLLLKMKEDHADVVACGFAKVFDSDDEELFTDTCYGRWSGHESVIEMMRSNNICTTAWNKLYKKCLFDGIRFPVGDKNEDEATTYKILYTAGIVSYIPEPLYKYYQRSSSIMHEDLEDRYKDFLKASRDRVKYFRDLNEKELEQHSLITMLEWIKYSYRNISKKEIKQELLNLYKNNISISTAPSVMGVKKQIALWLWKYIRY